MIPSFCLTRLNQRFNTMSTNYTVFTQAEIDAFDAEEYAVFLATGTPAPEEPLAQVALGYVEHYREFDL